VTAREKRDKKGRQRVRIQSVPRQRAVPGHDSFVRMRGGVLLLAPPKLCVRYLSYKENPPLLPPPPPSNSSPTTQTDPVSPRSSSLLAKHSPKPNHTRTDRTLCGHSSCPTRFPISLTRKRPLYPLPFTSPTIPYFSTCTFRRWLISIQVPQSVCRSSVLLSRR